MAGPDQPGKRIDDTRPQWPQPTSTPPSAPAGGGPPAQSPQPVGVGGAPGQPAPSAPGGPARPAGGPAPRRGIAYTTYAITVLIAVIAILVIVFVIKNDERVSVWLFGTTKRMSVAGALAASAAAGLVVGLLLGVIPQIKLRRELRQLRRAARG